MPFKGGGLSKAYVKQLFRDGWRNIEKVFGTAEFYYPIQRWRKQGTSNVEDSYNPKFAEHDPLRSRGKGKVEETYHKIAVNVVLVPQFPQRKSDFAFTRAGEMEKGQYLWHSGAISDIKAGDWLIFPLTAMQRAQVTDNQYFNMAEKFLIQSVLHWPSQGNPIYKNGQANKVMSGMV